MKTKNDKMKNHKYKLVAPNDPVLWAPSDRVTEEDDLSFLSGMEKVFRMSPAAVGLAAPQLGIGKQVILVAPGIPQGFVSRRTAQILFVANPEIISHSEDSQVDPEGCLSFPGITAIVSCWQRIVVRAQPIHSYSLQPHVDYLLEGWSARVWQHEINHLKGICHVGEEWKRRKS